MTAKRPEQPLKTQQLRKRYRQLRRKQLAGFLLAAGLILVVVLMLLIGIFVVRSCARQSEGALRQRLAAERGEDSLPEVVFERTFDPAPWLTAVADDALFCATDTAGRDVGYSSNYPIDHIAAYPLETGEDARWKTAAQSEFMGMAVARQSLVLYSYNLLETAQVSLRALDQQNGHELWSHTIEEAQSPSFVVSGKVLIVGYWLTDGYRLVGYNAETGVKAWGYRLGMLEEIDLSAGAAPLRLDASAERVCYSLGSNIGLIDSGSGRVLRRQELGLRIGRLAFDWDNGSCLLTSEPGADGACTLYRMPLSAGIPVELHRFVPDRGIPQLVHFAGKSLLAYSGHPAGDDEEGCHILSFARGASTPQSHSVLPPGVPVAAAAFPGGAAGALVSVSTQLGEDGMPRGRGYLARVSAESGSASQHSRLARPITALLPFKHDIVMLYSGGGLRVFAAAVGQHLHLAELSEAHSGWSYSPDRGALLVTSYPQSHAQGRPGGRFQAIVLK